MNTIEIAKLAWERWGDCELEHWKAQDGYVQASGIPKRAKKDYSHVFVFVLGPGWGEQALKSIIRAPWHTRIRFDLMNGLPTVSRYLFKMIPEQNGVWGKPYIAGRV